MFKRNFYILSIVILSSILTLCSMAKDSISEFLPKTKDTAKDAEDKSGLEENEKEEISNPEDSFKLVAIYLVGNKPRALIKNLEKPEDPAKEYQIGDYVDELQTFLISKILLNPTTRIELTDPNGLSYVLKGKNADGTASSQSSKSSPSYASGSNKSKIKRVTTSSATSSPKPTEKKEEAGALESAVRNDTATITPPPVPPPATPPSDQPQNSPPPQDSTPTPAQSPPGGALQAQSNTPTPVGKTDSMTASLAPPGTDLSRPSNPFGE